MMPQTTPLAYDSAQIFHELPFLEGDRKLLDLVRACFQVQREVGGTALLPRFQRHPNPQGEVSPEALDRLLRSGVSVSDAVVNKGLHITNSLFFNTADAQTHLLNEQIIAMRQRVDEAVAVRIRRLFQEGDRLHISNSGHIWYPPGGYMGWHTNQRYPGWRLYINYCEEPGRSFFRYRDPDTGALVTAVDREWNFRLFRVTAEKPFWHAVYSDTHRFSLGYRILLMPKPNLRSRIKHGLLQLAGLERSRTS